MTGAQLLITVRQPVFLPRCMPSEWQAGAEARGAWSSEEWHQGIDAFADLDNLSAVGMHSMRWWRCLRLLTAGRPGLAFSFPTAPAGGAALKQTSPYWYSFSVAVKSLGGCEVLFASTCAEHQLSAVHCVFFALEQTSPHLWLFSVVVNCLSACEVQTAFICAILPLWLACVAMQKHPSLRCILHRPLQFLQTLTLGHEIRQGPINTLLSPTEHANSQLVGGSVTEEQV